MIGEMAEETKSSVYFDPGIKVVLDGEIAKFGTQKRVLAAAILMFSRASNDDKLRFIEEVPKHQRAVRGGVGAVSEDRARRAVEGAQADAEEKKRSRHQKSVAKKA